MDDLQELKTANASRWSKAKLLRNFTAISRHLVEPSAKARYRMVEMKTGVPWSFIAVVHERESSQSWKGSLAQGDPWDKVSVHVPAGRGPFASWEEAAIDALVNCAPHAAANTDWSIGGTLTMLERYNGLGYYGRGLPSPYIWAGTDQYSKGKFVRDGAAGFAPNVVDTQLGCAGLLKAMQILDPSIAFIAAGAPKAAAAPSISAPAPGSIGAAIASAISAILSLFRSKP